VLTLLDARDGRPAALGPAHPGELRLLVSAAPGSGAVRAFLAADLIRRVAERRGLLVTLCHLADPAEDLAALRGDCAALNVYPPEHTLPPAPPADLAARLAALFPGGGAAATGRPLLDAAVGEPDAAACLARVAAVPGPVTGEAGSVREVTRRGLDPLALRLALLRLRYREPAGLGWEALHAADKTLRRWREQVAAWARSPSTAMSRRYAGAVTAAFDDDLDTPAALREIGAMAGDAAEADGTRFETFAAADRLLGLDLARDVGS